MKIRAPRQSRLLVLGVLSLFGATTVHAEPPHAAAVPAPPIIERLDTIRARLLEHDAALVQSSHDEPTNTPIAQWLNWPNWNNWSNWTNWLKWINY